MVSKLKEVGFKVSTIDECLFYKDTSVFVLYTDDSILAGPDSKELDCIIKQMKKVGLNLTVEGDITDFLGVQINCNKDGKFNLTQPHLIADIIRELRLEDDKVTIKSTPGASSKPLTRCLEEPDFDLHFDYQKVIGKVNYLRKKGRI